MSNADKIFKDRINEILVDIAKKEGLYLSPEAFVIITDEDTLKISPPENSMNRTFFSMHCEVVRDFHRKLRTAEVITSIPEQTSYPLRRSSITLKALDEVFGKQGREIK